MHPEPIVQDAPLLVSLPPASRGQQTDQRTPEALPPPLHSLPTLLPASGSLPKASDGG